MIPIVEFPEIVEHYGPFYEGVFSAEAFVEFKRYISGLLLSENKTIAGMNQLFVNEKRSQSSLNRLLTRSPYSKRQRDELSLNSDWSRRCKFYAIFEHWR